MTHSIWPSEIGAAAAQRVHPAMHWYGNLSSRFALLSLREQFNGHARHTSQNLNCGGRNFLQGGWPAGCASHSAAARLSLLLLRVPKPHAQIGRQMAADRTRFSGVRL
ncbi:hypothetical protein AGR7B_Lc180077 [Agrobacterium deltaense RV3]|nr:hypothetical protein AGR7B_Lc180077 [Agrobacterium deltaense RV3]